MHTESFGKSNQIVRHLFNAFDNFLVGNVLAIEGLVRGKDESKTFHH